MKKSAKILGKSLVVVFAAVGMAINPLARVPKASAVCSPATTYGIVTLTVSVPSATTYRAWSRIMAPDTTNNTYALEVDNGNCITVGGGSIPANAWTWVDYQNGSSSNKINLTLAAGTHTLRLIGVQPSVAVDRIILTSDTACVPTPASGTGENCANPPDTVAPTASITTPANNATVAGNAVAIAANADDESGIVSRVEFYINDSLVATDTTSSYGITWDTTSVANGSYRLVARAYDAANNVGTSSTTTVTVNNTVPDTTIPTVSITAPANNSTVNGPVTVSASANDNVHVARVEFYVDGTVTSTDTTSPYTASVDTTRLSNGTHTLMARAYDDASNPASHSVIVTVNNTGGGGGTPPAKPGDGNNDDRVNFTDVIYIAAHYNQTVTPYTYGDVNGDGRVNFQDIIIVAAHYGQ